MKPALFSKVLGDRPLDEVIELTAELGYDGIEIRASEPHFPADTSPERAERVGERLDDAGLSVPCLATYTGYYDERTDAEAESELADLARFAELAGFLDCDLIRHKPGGPPVRDATEDDYERAAGYVRRAADIAAEHGATIGIEIHAGRLVETVESTLRFLELVDRDNVGVIHDAGNMFIVDADFGRESIERLGDRLVHVHVKDIARVDDASAGDAFATETNRGREAFRHRPLDEGEVDHLPAFAALAEAGYDGFLTAETAAAPPEGRDDLDVARRELNALERSIERASAAR